MKVVAGLGEHADWWERWLEFQVLGMFGHGLWGMLPILAQVNIADVPREVRLVKKFLVTAFEGALWVRELCHLLVK